MPILDPDTFLIIAVHAAATDKNTQHPRISAEQAREEAYRDAERAELRCMMEQPAYR